MSGPGRGRARARWGVGGRRRRARARTRRQAWDPGQYPGRRGLGPRLRPTTPFLVTLPTLPSRAAHAGHTLLPGEQLRPQSSQLVAAATRALQLRGSGGRLRAVTAAATSGLSRGSPPLALAPDPLTAQPLSTIPVSAPPSSAGAGGGAGPGASPAGPGAYRCSTLGPGQQLAITAITRLLACYSLFYYHTAFQSYPQALVAGPAGPAAAGQCP